MKRNTRQPVRSARWIAVAALAIACLPFVEAARAQSMTSTNYKIPFDAFSGGGSLSTSTNYRLEDTVTEQASPTGENLSSTNYRACVGYQCLKEAPFLTVVYAVQSGACDGTSSSSPPYAVPLGTLTTASVTTGSNRVCVRVTTNASGGVLVNGKSTNAGLRSTGTPGDIIASGTESLTAANEGYGVCSSNAQNGFTALSPFNGTCNTGAGHSVGGLTTTDQTIWSINGPVNNAFGEMLTKASISGVTPAHNDYADTLIITVTGTY